MRFRFAAALITAGVLCAGAAQANSFHSAGTITGPGGNVWQRAGNTNYGPGYINHQGSLTTPYGQTYTRNGAINYAPGTVSSQSTIAGPNGAPILTRNGSTTYGDGVYNHATTYTGPNGQTYGWTSTGTYGAGQ